MENMENKAPDNKKAESTPENGAPQSESPNSAPKQKSAKPLSGKTIGIIAAAVALVAIIVIVIVVLAMKKEPEVVLPDGDYTSPTALAMSEDGENLYIADATGRFVYKVRLSDKKVIAVYRTETSVQDVAVSGENVFVAEGGLGGKLVKLNADLEKQGELVTGHTPTDICVVGNVAYVANRFSNTVSSVDISAMTESKNIAVSREPVTLTLSGSDLYVGCLLTDDPANTNDTRAKVCVISTSSGEMTNVIELPNGAESVRGIIASSDGSTVYVSHIVGHYQLPTTQLDAGWVNTNVISVIDTSSKSVKYSYTLDDVDLGAANPWGLALSEDEKELYVAISGTNQVIVVDLNKMSTLVKAVERGTSGIAKSLDEILNYINFASSAKTRLDLSGAGVRTVLCSGSKLYVGEYFAGNVEVIDTESLAIVDAITVREQKENDPVRLGELSWYDATHCYQMWQSCNSCHPDARASGLSWDELGDGIGTSKQTKTMLFATRTPPCLATGVEPNAEHNVFGSVSGTPQWNSGDEAETISNNIIAFLRSLMPTASPYLNNDGTLTAAAEHGKELFAQYNCTVCHPAPFYTDLKPHNMGTTDFDSSWEYRDIDTPSLVEAWRSAPWTYTGHFNSMVDCVKYFATRNGGTISDADANDLAEYVLSIGAENEQYSVVQITNTDDSYNTFDSSLNIKAISVVKQAAGAPSGTLTLTICDADGKALTSTSIELSELKYGVVCEFPLESELSTSGGAYYTVTITDSDGNKLASDLKID